MMAGVVRSGASVAMVTPPCGVLSRSTASPSSERSLLDVVHAAPFVAEERPFDVDAEHAGNALRDGIAHGVDGALDHVQVVADQRGQEPRGAEASMRAANGGDGSRRSDRR